MTTTKLGGDKIVKTVNILRCKVVNIDKLQDLLGHSIIILRGLTICEPDQVTALTGRRRGRCKWFNVAKGWGFITPNDGGPDVFVHQSVIQMNGFRSLGEEEEVEFECKVSDKGLEATLVTGVEGLECKGSQRKPIGRKKFKKVRCYNCGEFANHIAAKCNMGPQPKKCHHCKAVDHLIADCPVKDEKSKNCKKSNNQQHHHLEVKNESDQSSEDQEENSRDIREEIDLNKNVNESNESNATSIESSQLSTTASAPSSTTTTPTATSSTTSNVKSPEPIQEISMNGSTEVETPERQQIVQCNNSTPLNSVVESEVNCCVDVIIMNESMKGSLETSETSSETDDVTVETQSTSSSVESTDSGKEIRSDSGIVHDDEINRSISRNSCDINNNNIDNDNNNNNINDDNTNKNNNNHTNNSNANNNSNNNNNNNNIILSNNIKNCESNNNTSNDQDINCNNNTKKFINGNDPEIKISRTISTADKSSDKTSNNKISPEICLSPLPRTESSN